MHFIDVAFILLLLFSPFTPSPFTSAILD